MSKKNEVKNVSTKGGAKAGAKNAVVKAEAGKEQASKVLVWLKSRAYINDTERVEAGVYLVEKCPERLARLKSDTCEVLAGEVNSRKIAQISRWAGLNPDGMSDEELLSKLISPEFKPFS